MMDRITPADFDRWRRNPAAFIEEVLIDPETGEPFKLTGAERRFLRRAFECGDDGRLKRPELLFSAIKKTGKTTFAAMLVLFAVLVLGGRFAEAYVLANDLEQAQSRVFTAIRRIVENSPILLADEPAITMSKIEFPATGATIQAIASDYAGAAGPSAFPKVDPTIGAPQNVRRFNGSRAKEPDEL